MGSRSAVLILSNPVTVILLLSLCNVRGVGLSAWPLALDSAGGGYAIGWSVTEAPCLYLRHLTVDMASG